MRQSNKVGVPFEVWLVIATVIACLAGVAMRIAGSFWTVAQRSGVASKDSNC